jgi:hypothetical protein
MIVLMGLSYGTRLPEDPGDSNIEIARIIAEIKDQIDFCEVQIEIGIALRKIGMEPDLVVTEHRARGQYLNTRENIEQMVDYLVLQGFDLSKVEIWTVSHNIHKSGIKAILKDLGLKPAKQFGTSVYDPLSYQAWTIGPVIGWVYKIKAGFNYLSSGQVRFLSAKPFLLPYVQFTAPDEPFLNRAVRLFEHNLEIVAHTLSEAQEALGSHNHRFCFPWSRCRKLENTISTYTQRLQMYQEAIADLKRSDPDKAIAILDSIIPQLYEHPLMTAERMAKAPGVFTSLSRSPWILRGQMQQLRDELVKLRKS